MLFDPINLLQWLLASAGITAGAILLARKRWRPLSALLIVYGVHMMFNALEETGTFTSDLHITSALGLLYWPILFLFIRHLIQPDKVLGVPSLVHLLPAVCVIVFGPTLVIIRLTFVVTTLFYVQQIVRMIWAFHKETSETRSDAMSLRLNWVYWILAGFAGLTLIDALRMLTTQWQPEWLMQASYASLLIAVAVLLGVLVFFGVTQPRYLGPVLTARDSAVISTKQPRDEAKGAGENFEKIEQVMRSRDLFLEAHLTVSEVATAAGLSEREVSRAINLTSGRRFCDYVNGYRIRRICEMLVTRPDETILSIAFDAGFTSKSSFNAAFKRETGRTPSDFRRSL